MPVDAATLSLALAGLLAGAVSGLHCGAMCGGIVSAHAAFIARPQRQAISLRLVTLTASASPAAPLSAVVPLKRSFAFNIGRIASYTLAGALAGSISAAAWFMQDSMPFRQALFIVANLMLIALGLHIAGIWRGILVLERAGTMLWRRVQPLATRLLRSGTASWPHSLALGAAWGWIPCGLVYAMLATATASGSAINGALVMFAFGLGTLPNMLLLGLAGNRLQPLLRRPGVRRLAGLAIIIFGLIGLARLPALGNLGRYCQTLLAGG